MKQPQSLTSIGQSPEDERRSRILRYSLAMSVRVLCIFLAMVVQGWLAWIFIAGAVLLPYFAVVIANAVGSGKPTVSKAVAPTLVIESDSFTKTEPPSPKADKPESEQDNG